MQRSFFELSEHFADMPDPRPTGHTYCVTGEAIRQDHLADTRTAIARIASDNARLIDLIPYHDDGCFTRRSRIWTATSRDFSEP
jgi:hypothetical protein